MKIKSHIRKKFAVYLPRKIVRHLNLHEGDLIEITVNKEEFLIRPVPNPLSLALEGKKFATIDPETIEGISEEEQIRYAQSNPETSI